MSSNTAQEEPLVEEGEENRDPNPEPENGEVDNGEVESDAAADVSLPMDDTAYAATDEPMDVVQQQDEDPEDQNNG